MRPYPQQPVKPWKTTSYGKFSKELTEESLEQYKKDFTAWSDDVTEWARTRKANIEYIVQGLWMEHGLFTSIGVGKKQQSLYDAISKFYPVALPTFRACINISQEKEYLEEQKSLANKKIKKETQDKLKTEAVKFCLDNGLEIGKDFTVDTAINVATNVAYEKAVAENTYIKGWISFAGDDNCVNCQGWRPTEHRCNCGNRRVGWEWHGDWKTGYLEAVAN